MESKAVEVLRDFIIPHYEQDIDRVGITKEQNETKKEWTNALKEALLWKEKLDRLEKWLDNEINQRKKDQLEYGALIRIEDQIILLKEVREVLK